MAVRGLSPVWLLLAGALVAAPAMAQDDASASPPDNPMDRPAATDGADVSSSMENFSLGKALLFDPATLADAPAKRLRLPGYTDSASPDVSRDEKADGSSTYTVKKPLPYDLDSKAGADLTPTPLSIHLPGQPVRTSSDNSGAAWASVGLPNLASVDARVDPNSDQSKVGTTLQRAVPIGSTLSVTVQDTFSLTDTLSARASTDGGPLLAATPPSSPVPTQFWGNEKRVKFDILPSGTSLAAGVITSSLDPVTHNTFSADQKIYGPLHVSTAVNDVGQATASKSLTAGFKVNW